MPSHLSLILDKDAAQEHPQLLAFLNSHIALQHENTLAVFAALPGKR
jgi:transcription initiation factor TFIIH subunit 3